MPPAEAAATRSGSTRARPTVLLIVAIVLLVARVAAGIYEERHPPVVADLVRWQPIAGSEATAHEQRRAILYDFTADWCVPCQVMQREVFADPEIAREIERGFLPVRVLDRTREEGRNAPAVDSLIRRYRVNSFPTLVVVPLRGDPVVMVGYEGKSATVQGLRAAMVQSFMPPGMRPPPQQTPGTQGR